MTHVHNFTISTDDPCVFGCECGTQTQLHDWVTVAYSQPLCIWEGYEEMKCSKCGETKKDILVATGHNYNNFVCTMCGQFDPDHKHDVIAGTCSECKFEVVAKDFYITNTSDVRRDFSLNNSNGLVLTLDYTTSNGDVVRNANTMAMKPGAKYHIVIVNGRQWDGSNLKSLELKGLAFSND